MISRSRHLKLLIGMLLFLSGQSLTPLKGSDWPIYKGNIYFTGNNDEIIVKNGNLKWLFQAEDRVYNPVVSDGRVYFVDQKAVLYCLNEEYGRLLWKIDMKKISAQFRAFSRSAGKIKYPLIQGDYLILSDPVALYAFNKRTGDILWARTGMNLDMPKPHGPGGSRARPVVDGIYADPLVLKDRIFYGTRNFFFSRDLESGRMKWDNGTVKTYSGFPTFYDDLIFTQSMDYATGQFRVYCLKADSGREVWSQSLAKPVRIFPPVIYRGRLYLPSEKSLYCLNLKTGDKIWNKEYADLITSVPGFTDRAILFITGNSTLTVVDPENGSVLREIKTPPRSSPYFITTRDQIYLAYNEYRTLKGREVPFGRVRALNFSDERLLWEYVTPFPGAVSQPVSSGGIMFLPAGNYLYAIGTEYFARVIDGGDGFAVLPPGSKGAEGGSKGPDGKGKSPAPKPPERKMDEADRKPQPPGTRRIKVTVKDDDGKGIPTDVEIKMRDKDKVVFHKKTSIDRTGELEIPKGKRVELIISRGGYMPRKIIVTDQDTGKEVKIEKIKKGRGIVVDQINFTVNSAYLRRESLDILEKLVQIMKGNPTLKVEVRGHTDAAGTRAYNQKLSERRADAVAEYMIKNGISPERVRAVGFGETRPIASNKTKEGKKKNRRTEIFFLE